MFGKFVNMRPVNEGVSGFLKRVGVRITLLRL